jgi:hypothetical protein
LSWKPPFFQSRLFSFLIISTGIVIGLLLIKLAFPGRFRTDGLSPNRPLFANTGMDAGPGVKNPTPTLGFQAVISNPPSEANNCSYTDKYWLENPAAWPADNIVIYTQRAYEHSSTPDEHTHQCPSD